MKHPPRNIDQSCFDWQKIILKKTDLPYTAKYLALYLATYMNMNRDFAYPGLKTIERETGLGHASVLKYLQLLVDEGWIGKQSGSSTKTNTYWITFPEGVGREVTYVSSEGRVGREVTSNNNRITNTLSKGDSKSSRFKPPTVDQILEYCKEMGYSVNAERFHAYYESNGWMVGRTKMKSWKAALTSWNTREQQNGKDRNHHEDGRKLSGAERTRIAREEARKRQTGG